MSLPMPHGERASLFYNENTDELIAARVDDNGFLRTGVQAPPDSGQIVWNGIYRTTSDVVTRTGQVSPTATTYRA
ncbi:hypothetical protein JOD54_005629 [Actinokineospora baliensis]|uniref:hypothetical protein n=1 Tax=Actinokineospora baliensis TaxID=547056 RepID=UPI0019592AA5|nr:hypothetical protein [Actinokineospora baliensis]MBM7775425.1 hypothetical protein [Actinokineospora baliensis]